jgi:hypothetical protein
MDEVEVKVGHSQEPSSAPSLASVHALWDLNQARVQMGHWGVLALSSELAKIDAARARWDWSTAMTVRLLGISVALLAACGSREPPPAVPQNPSPSATAESAARALTTSECEALAQWIATACHDREALRSAQIDGWCSDIERRTTPEDRSWIAECVEHVKYMDNACFRSTTSVRNQMDCDSAVSR